MAQSVSAESIQAVSFSIVNPAGKKEDYAVPIEQVREIRAVEKITKVPRSESYVKGIMNLRGLIIPVIDVKEKLGLGSDGKSNSTKQRILVAEVSGTLTGLLVDEVDQVMRLQTKDIEAAPQGAFESYNYINGIAKINEKLVILLDVVSLLGGLKEKPESLSNTQSKPQIKSSEKPDQIQKPQQTENTTNAQPLDDNIPPELAEVFKEDAQGIPPTQIIRESETTSN
ncbi:MAG TPA: chemotaxis protein CheW [Candidatus Nitrosotenuis sp.]|nr:chemotaxis protein CheW [Candidatus Nitrosotenuis sp.]